MNIKTLEAKICQNYIMMQVNVLQKKDHDLNRYGYKISRLLTQDIDTEEDFKLAEYIFKVLIIK